MKIKLLSLLLTLILLVGCAFTDTQTTSVPSLPEEIGNTPYITLNNNQPDFTDDDITIQSYEQYSDLDYLGRCGTAIACIGQDIMPTEERESIGQVKPSGWQTVKYDIVDGKYLYNRCHLIGYQLTGENANERNLITGTRYLNTEGMLPFENAVAEYVEQTGNHVLYRVIPRYEGNNLLASGVTLEAMSVEDMGDGLCFHVYCPNIQPGIVIDYATGNSQLDPHYQNETSSQTSKSKYILNTKSKKFHLPECDSVDDIKTNNRQDYIGSRNSLINQNYSPCKSCNP
jgi:DNA-entry nuclease